jgi:hypothetical protein
MSMLDEANIPWAVLSGNHDLTGGSTNYNTYFGYSRFSGQSWYGGAYLNINTNSYQLFTGGLDDYLIFHLQYQPNPQVLAWANTIIANYPSRRVIVTTHDYLNTDGSRTDAGNNIYNNFVKPHADQIFLVLCGHMHGENKKVDVVNGHTVYQLLADYQDRSPKGGNGWLRILEFHPSDDEVIVKTYSSYLGQYETDADSSFTLSYDMTNHVPNTMYVGVRGGGDSIWWSSVDTDINHQSDWNPLTGSTPSSPSIFVSGSTMYLAVRGSDDLIYWTTVETDINHQSDWNPLTGSTPSSPSIFVSGSTMYIGVRGVGDSIWWTTVDVNTKAQSDWNPLTGSSPSSPSIYVSGTTMYVGVRGSDSSIYWCTVNTVSKVPTSWSGLEGSTPSSPSIYVSGTTMYICVRGIDNSIYWCTVDTGTKVPTGWNGLVGSTPSSPSIYVSETTMYVGVRGNDSSIYWCTVNTDSKVPTSWSGLEGSTPSSPSMNIQ